jgi:hypothetical protein
MLLVSRSVGLESLRTLSCETTGLPTRESVRFIHMSSMGALLCLATWRCDSIGLLPQAFEAYQRELLMLAAVLTYSGDQSSAATTTVDDIIDAASVACSGCPADKDDNERQLVDACCLVRQPGSTQLEACASTRDAPVAFTRSACAVRFIRSHKSRRLAAATVTVTPESSDWRSSCGHARRLASTTLSRSSWPDTWSTFVKTSRTRTSVRKPQLCSR